MFIKTDHPDYNRIMRGVMRHPEPTAESLARSASVQAAIQRTRQDAASAPTGITPDQINAQEAARRGLEASRAITGMVRI